MKRRKNPAGLAIGVGVLGLAVGVGLYVWSRSKQTALESAQERFDFDKGQAKAHAAAAFAERGGKRVGFNASTLRFSNLQQFESGRISDRIA